MPRPPSQQLLSLPFYGWALLSLGLHGIILWLPLRESPVEPEIILEPPPAAIAVTRLPKPAAPEPPALPPPAPPPAPRPQPQPSQPAPVPAPTPNQQPIPAPEPEPAEASPAELHPVSSAPAPATSGPATFSATGTTDGEALNAFTAWHTNMRAQHGLSPEFISDRMVVDYPIQPNCRNPAPGNASIGVLAEADGTVSDEPQIIKNTGYSDLDTWIVNAVKAKTFDEAAAAGTRKALSFEVELNYTGTTCDPPP